MGDSMIDIEARDRIADLDKRLTEVSNDYWGPNRDNGTRSIVREHDAEIDHLRTEMRHYVDTRGDTCLGLKKIAEYEATREESLYEEGKEDAEVTIANGNNKAKLSEAKLTLLGIVLVATLSLVGQVITGQQNRTTQQQLVVLTHALEKGN